MTYKVNEGRAIGITGLYAAYTINQLGYPGIGDLPSVPTEPQFGEVVTAWDLDTNANATGAGGFGQFIFLRIPASTAITANLLYRFNAATYDVVIVPTSLGTQALSGAPIALAINTVASSTSLQGSWFQCGGRGTVLKTAVTVPADVPVYISGTTAGRIKILGSAFRAIIGARTANAASVTSTTSTVAIYLNGYPCITAGI